MAFSFWSGADSVYSYASRVGCIKKLDMPMFSIEDLYNSYPRETRFEHLSKQPHVPVIHDVDFEEPQYLSKLLSQQRTAACTLKQSSSSHGMDISNSESFSEVFPDEESPRDTLAFNDGKIILEDDSSMDSSHSETLDIGGFFTDESQSPSSPISSHSSYVFSRPYSKPTNSNISKDDAFDEDTSLMGMGHLSRNRGFWECIWQSPKLPWNLWLPSSSGIDYSSSDHRDNLICSKNSIIPAQLPPASPLMDIQFKPSNPSIIKPIVLPFSQSVLFEQPLQFILCAKNSSPNALDLASRFKKSNASVLGQVTLQLCMLPNPVHSSQLEVISEHKSMLSPFSQNSSSNDSEHYRNDLSIAAQCSITCFYDGLSQQASTLANKSSLYVIRCVLLLPPSRMLSTSNIIWSSECFSIIKHESPSDSPLTDNVKIPKHVWFSAWNSYATGFFELWMNRLVAQRRSETVSTESGIVSTTMEKPSVNLLPTLPFAVASNMLQYLIIRFTPSQFKPRMVTDDEFRHWFAESGFVYCSNKIMTTDHRSIDQKILFASRDLCAFVDLPRRKRCSDISSSFSSQWISRSLFYRVVYQLANLLYELMNEKNVTLNTLWSNGYISIGTPSVINYLDDDCKAAFSITPCHPGIHKQSLPKFPPSTNDQNVKKRYQVPPLLDCETPLQIFQRLLLDDVEERSSCALELYHPIVGIVTVKDCSDDCIDHLLEALDVTLLYGTDSTGSCVKKLNVVG